MNSSVNKAGAPITWQEITAVARTWQYDRYLAATLAARHNLNDLIILAAFAAEVDRILATVSEPAIAAIRLQWWRDALDTPAPETTGNPLADQLRNTMHGKNLPGDLFAHYIEAQDVELYSDLLPDLAALDDHFTNRDGILFELAICTLGVTPDAQMREAIKAGAQAYGFARTLVQLPLRLQSRQFLLPADIAERHGIWPGESIDLSRFHTVRDDLAQTAEDRLAAYRRLFPALPRTTHVAMLPVALTGFYISLARRHVYAAKEFEVELSRIDRAWRMLKAHLLGRI